MAKDQTKWATVVSRYPTVIRLTTKTELAQFSPTIGTTSILATSISMMKKSTLKVLDQKTNRTNEI